MGPKLLLFALLAPIFIDFELIMGHIALKVQNALLVHYCLKSAILLVFGPKSGLFALIWAVFG